MSDESYFREKALEKEQEANKENKKFIEMLKGIFFIAGMSILNRIKNSYSDLENDEEISYSNMKKLLKPKEISEFKAELSTFKQEIEKNDYFVFQQRFNGFTSQKDNIIHKYDYLKANHIINRETKLLTEIEYDVNKVMANFESLLSVYLSKQFKNNYYQNFYNVFKEMGKGTTDFKKLDEDMIEKVLAYPWSGANFSDRIWSNKEKLIETLREELVKHFISGEDYETTAKRVQEKLDCSFFDAYRIVQTESSRIVVEADRESFIEMGVEKYEIISVLDSKTSKKCRAEDGKIYEYKDIKIGVNAPPFHPLCRTTTAPYYDDIGNYGKRIARSADGQSYKVSVMTYNEWETKYVEKIKNKRR